MISLHLCHTVSQGAPVNYTHFEYGHKDPETHYYDDCVAMEAEGRWDDIPCNERFGYVCKFGKYIH